ncbi:hypothetical protein QA612_19055 [Evansella sp. AB-P1]|uniref:hypothetical protein n=1 Tax=Evansella sp. AB-P1 TaxID=3037653 RepID=UPI00241F5AE2|nr:hypothetical protein [Evansella sp. AB-P1]MDG5789562.1 hypothetical protein [Evansella sp. AB-P1]
MSNNPLKEILVKWATGFVEYLSLFPLLVIIGIYFIPTDLILIWFIILPVIFLVGVICGALLRLERMMFFILISAVVSVSVGYFIMEEIFSRLFMMFFSMFMMMRGISYGKKEWASVYHTVFSWLSLSIYFILAFLFPNIDHLQAYTNLIIWAGMLTLVITLFIQNSRQLQVVTLSKKKSSLLSRSVILQNRFFIILTLVFVVILANYRMIQDGFLNTIGFIFLSISRFVTWLFTFLNGEEILEEREFGMAPPTGEPGNMSNTLLIILLICISVVVILMIVYIIKKFMRVLKGVFSWVMKWLKQLLNKAGAEQDASHYFDEKESVLNWKDWRKKYQDRAKDFLSDIFKREPSWTSLKNNRERARYIYRHVILEQIKQGYPFKRSETPKETLRNIKGKEKYPLEENKLNRLEKAYEKAKYSNDEISDNDVMELKQLIKKRND